MSNPFSCILVSALMPFRALPALPVACLLAALLVGSATGSQVLAQQRGLQYEVMKAPVDLPNFPMYTGKIIFVHGVKYPKSKYQPALRMTFFAKEKADDVMDFFKQSLPASGWRIQEKQSTENSVIATSKNLRASIDVSNSASMTDYKSSFTISYTATVSRGVELPADY